jgi:hypothetical protein
MRPTTPNPHAKASFSSFGMLRERHGPLPLNDIAKAETILYEFGSAKFLRAGTRFSSNSPAIPPAAVRWRYSEA